MSNYIEVDAKTNNWETVYEFLSELMKEYKIQAKIISHVLIACEEIFINISNYAYPDSVGKAYIEFNYDKKNNQISVLMKDSGIKFNPTEYTTPKINASVSDRKIGGLGIFVTKNIVDSVKYEYVDNNNCLILTKNIN